MACLESKAHSALQSPHDTLLQGLFVVIASLMINCE